MAGSSSNGVASANIVCDPSNYDWTDDLTSGAVPGDTTPVKNYIEAKADNDPIVLNVVPDASIIPPSRKATVWANNKTTDKDLFDFIYGESTNQTLMRLSNQFVPIVEEGADTLIHIGPPPKAKGQTDHEYEYVKRAFHRPYLLRSDTLRKLGSAKFNEFLGPKSKRTQRKLQKAGIHKLLLEPEKIKYFIDLTPDIHDDEGMVLLLELSVPSGARSWHKDAQRFNIQTSHVCGRDALDMLPKPMYRPQSQDGPKDDEDDDAAKGSDTNNTNTAKEKSGKKAALEDSDTSEEGHEAQQDVKPVKKKDEPYMQPEEDDYSQLRHHTGIVRLLQAIAGQDPKLNSAPKAWTFCMLAKFFDCAKNEAINGWITDWLVQSGNLNFIQTNPSTSYRFGTAMGTTWLVRASFCVLVGLKAFEHVKAFSDAVFNAQGHAPLNVPPASRITDGLDDDDINRVDHAALALVKRVNGQLQRLLAENGAWKDCLAPGTHMAKLYQLELADPEAKDALDETKKSLDHYVRRLLCAPLVEFDDTKGSKGNMFRPPMNITSYHIIPPQLRPLTLQFWEAMRSQDLLVDPSFSTHLGHYSRWERTLESLRNDGALAAENTNVPYVSRGYLDAAVDLLNSMQYGVEANAWPASPNKKVKLSPPPKHRKQPATNVGPNDFLAVPARPSVKMGGILGVDSGNSYKETKFTERFFPAQPATFLQPSQNPDAGAIPEMSESSTYTVRGQSLIYPGSSGISFEGDEEKSPLLKDDKHQVSAELAQDESDDEPESDGWEDVAVDLEAQSKGVRADPTACVRGLPIRSKPMPSQISPAQASGEFSPSHIRGKPPSKQDEFSTIADEVYANMCPSISGFQSMQYPETVNYGNPGPRPMQYPTAVNYGNPNKPRPFDAPDRVTFSNALSNQLKEALDLYRGAMSSGSRDRFSDLPVTDPDPVEADYVRPTVYPRFPSPPSFEPEETPIVTDVLLTNINSQIRFITTPILLPGFMADGYCAYDIPLNEIGTLTCLSEEEYKYLPLWAGGNDDGSGGVFDDGEEIPEAPEVEFGGFRGGAMGIIPGVGSTVSGSVAGSEFEEISTEVGVSTVGRASRIATDGADTVMSLDE